jgi:hypothetical protein
MTKVIYIFMLSDDDIGPKEHVRNVLQHSNCYIDVMSNLDSVIWSRCIVRTFESKFKSSILNSLVFQFKALSYLLFNSKYDVVLLRQSVGFFIIPLFKFLYKGNVHIEVNGVQRQDLIDRNKPFISKINSILENITYSYADKILCVHENIKTALLAHFRNLDLENIYVVENGIEPIPYLSAQDAKKQANISSATFRIGYLGSLAHREGVELLVEVAKHTNLKNIKFIIVGGTDEEIDILKNKIKIANVEDVFEIKSYLPLKDALFIMQTCDVCIHLRRPIKGKSNSQGSPLKMLDYHNIGRYVIATDIDSYKYIKQQDLGNLVALDNFQLIYQHLEKLRTDDSIVAKGLKGHKMIQIKTWANQIALLDDILND